MPQHGRQYRGSSKGDSTESTWFDRFVERVQGDPALRQPRTEGYFSRPIAPAPVPVLFGVVLFSIVMLAAVADQFRNDYLASGACFLVLLTGAAALDVTGRRRAVRDPSPLYRPDGLPSGSQRLKVTLVLTTFSAVITHALITVKPGEWGSPLPYFYAAAFLFLVMPQYLARREVRQSARLTPDGEKDSGPRFSR